MYEAEFTLEAVTPIFMRGADQAKAEIRAASIKGLMRWWFRALAGNYFGNDIAGLRKAEEYVFGSTNRKSRVFVEVEAPTPSKLHFRPGQIDRKSKVGELRYLWFSVHLLSRRGQFQYYYPLGTKFELQIRAHAEREFNLALLSLWALVTLGGMGFRSRRGAGSLHFAGGDLDLFAKHGANSEFSSIEELKTSIYRVVELTGEFLGRKKVDEPNPVYPVLSDKTCCVALWDPKTGDVIEALRKFERNYSRFRRERISKPERIIFGLPVRLSGRGTEGIKEKLELLKENRRASPMIVGAIRIGEKLYLKIVKFKTSFHPYDEITELAKWEVLENFDRNLRETVIYGSPEIFTEVFP